MNTEITVINKVDLSAASTEGKSFDFRDLELPRLQLIRPNSRQLKKGEADYSKEAKQGMFYNSLTKEIYDPDTQDILFIPVVYKQIIALLTQPTLPGAMGDYVATVGPNDVQLKYDAELRKNIVVAGINVMGPQEEKEIPTVGLLADVRDQFSGVLIYDNKPQPIILTLKGKSKQVAGRKLKSMISMQKEAIYAHSYLLTSVPTQSANGDILIEEFKYFLPTRDLGDDLVPEVVGVIEMIRGA